MTLNSPPARPARRWDLRALGRALACLAVLAGGAEALGVSGRLAGPDGRGLDGVYLVTFGLFDAPEGGARVWSESLYVSASQGEFKAELGRLKPLPESVMRAAHRLEAETPAGTGWAVTDLRRADQRRAAALPAAAPPSSAPAPTPEPAAAPPEPAPAPRPAADDDVARLKRELEAAKRELAEKRAVEASRPRVYTVQAGDTLRSVARRVYGDPERWQIIFDANDDRIQRGGELSAGQKLVIPPAGDR